MMLFYILTWYGLHRCRQFSETSEYIQILCIALSKSYIKRKTLQPNYHYPNNIIINQILINGMNTDGFRRRYNDSNFLWKVS